KAKKCVRLKMEKLFGIELKFMLVTQKSDGFEHTVDFLNALPIRAAQELQENILSSYSCWSKNVNIPMPKVVVNAVKGNNLNAVEASACWDWKPKVKVLDHVTKNNSASIIKKKFNYVDAQGRSKVNTAGSKLMLLGIHLLLLFWSTAMAKTINEEEHIHARVDGKKVIITEASIRRDLQLADEEDKYVKGMSNHKRIYISPSHTKKIFGNMRRVGKGFSGRITPLFPTMMVQSEMGEGSAIPIDPYHTPTISQASSSLPQKTHKPRKLQERSLKYLSLVT
nr:hypothetical protein [Tanacetum cinerariifolium]